MSIILEKRRWIEVLKTKKPAANGTLIWDWHGCGAHFCFWGSQYQGKQQWQPPSKSKPPVLTVTTVDVLLVMDGQYMTYWKSAIHLRFSQFSHNWSKPMSQWSANCWFVEMFQFLICVLIIERWNGKDTDSTLKSSDSEVDMHVMDQLLKMERCFRHEKVNAVSRFKVLET
jgi:hypothetical protein